MIYHRTAWLLVAVIGIPFQGPDASPTPAESLLVPQIRHQLSPSPSHRDLFNSAVYKSFDDDMLTSVGVFSAYWCDGERYLSPSILAEQTAVSPSPTAFRHRLILAAPKQGPPKYPVQS